MFFHFFLVVVSVVVFTCTALNRAAVFYFIITLDTVLVVKYMTYNVQVTSTIQFGQVHSMFTRWELGRQLLKLCILSINGCYNLAISRFVFTAFIFDKNEISYLQVCRRRNFTSLCFRCYAGGVVVLLNSVLLFR